MSERGGDGFQFEMNFSVSRFGVSRFLKNGIRLHRSTVEIVDFCHPADPHDFSSMRYIRPRVKKSLMLIVLTRLSFFY